MPSILRIHKAQNSTDEFIKVVFVDIHITVGSACCLLCLPSGRWLRIMEPNIKVNSILYFLGPLIPNLFAKFQEEKNEVQFMFILTLKWLYFNSMRRY